MRHKSGPIYGYYIALKISANKVFLLLMRVNFTVAAVLYFRIHIIQIRICLVEKFKELAQKDVQASLHSCRSANISLLRLFLSSFR